MEKKFENKLQSILDELETVKSEMADLVEIAPEKDRTSIRFDDALESLDDVIGHIADGIEKIR